MVDARLTQDKVRLETTLHGVAGFDGDVVAGLSATGLRIEFPGFRRAYVEGTDDPEAELADQERILPPLADGRGRAGHERRGQGPRHATAGSLLRGDADQEVGGPRDRSSVDLRVGDEDDRPTGLRVEEGQVARAGLSGLRGRQPPPAVLRRPGRLPVHGRDGGRARRDRPGEPGPRTVAPASSTSAIPRRRPNWPSSVSST